MSDTMCRVQLIILNCCPEQLANLLSVMQPEVDPTATACPTRMEPNPVSDAIGSDGTDAGPDFTILFPITDGGAALTPGSIPEGLTTIASVPSALGTTMDNAALSISDFNFFRIQMIKALRVLDKSVRDILNTQAPTCP